MDRQYTIEIWVNGRWQRAHQSVTSRSAAEGLLCQFGLQYCARLLSPSGKPLLHRGTTSATEPLDIEGYGTGIDCDGRRLH